MPFDRSQDPLDPLVSQPRRAPPALMIAGVLGACTLGGALGLWARPTSEDVKLVAQGTANAPSAARPRQIEIRVDHPPVAAAEPVAAESAAEGPPATTTPEPQPELLAPKRPPAGLVKVHAIAPERLLEPDEADVRRARLAAEKAKAEARARAAAERKVEAARAEREAEAREARAEAKAAELRKARKEAARIAEAAEAKARAKAERKAERKAAEQVAAKQAASEKRQARLAAERRAERLAEQKLAEQKRKATPKALATAAPVKKVKVAKAASRCASADPGAAMACSDPALSAAERQLSRAYRQAEAAGVPSETLERQQQRWLAARSNAARKAPWAVHDIYLARIAELQDQTRQAGRGEDF